MGAARWALYLGALGVIGAFGATLLRFPANPRVMRTGRIASGILLLGCWLVITAQLYNWFGVEGLTKPENVWTMLSITLWGLHWTWLAGVTLGVVVVLWIGARRPPVWIVASGAAALGVTATVPLVGHGGTHDAVVLFWHRVHLFGAGAWIGSLSVAVVSGLNDREGLLVSLRRFAPIAFTGAALVGISGTALAWKHITTLSLLWTSDYGRVLLAKVITVLIVGALGFVNWRGPRMRVVLAEVTIAIVVVLTLTAWLSELEMPSGH